MTNRFGKINLDLLLFITIAVIATATIFSVALFYVNGFCHKTNGSDISAVYTDILLELRSDASVTAKAVPEKDKITLLNAENEIVSIYTFKENKLFKYSPLSKTNKPLIEKLKTASLWVNQKLPNLISVRLIPADTHEMPFFTSFALRGYVHD